MELINKETEIHLSKIHYTTISNMPPWAIKIPEINLNLNKHDKISTHPLNFLKKFEKIKESSPEHSYIFPDGSK